MSVRQHSIWKKLAFIDIMSLKASGNYTEIKSRNNTPEYFVLRSLDQFEQELPSIFFRCHRSAIVNMVYIQHIGTKNLTLNDGSSLPVSRHKILLLQKELNELDRLTIPQCRNCETCQEIDECRFIRPFMIGQ
jgi:DNA-binding LytR/AlgR family response regulator